MAELVLSDERLASISGVSRTTVFRIRKGTTYPHRNTLSRILAALDGHSGAVKFHAFIERNRSDKKAQEKKQRPSYILKLEEEKAQEEKIEEYRKSQKEEVHFSKLNTSFLKRKTDIDLYSENNFKKFIELLEERFGEKNFVVSAYTNHPDRYALRILPEHMDRLNFLSLRVLGSESYRYIGPLIGNCLLGYGNVSLTAGDKESALGAGKLAEQVFAEVLGRKSEEYFDAMFFTALVHTEMHEHKDAHAQYTRALKEIEDWDDTVLLALPYLIQDVIDPCIQSLEGQRDFEKQLDAYDLKLRATDIQLSRDELKHLRPENLSVILYEKIEHQFELWEQDESTETRYSALHTLDSSESLFGMHVKEKLERLVAINELEL